MIDQQLGCLGHTCCNCGRIYKSNAPLHYRVCDLRFIEVCPNCTLKASEDLKYEMFNYKGERVDPDSVDRWYEAIPTSRNP